MANEPQGPTTDYDEGDAATSLGTPFLERVRGIDPAPPRRLGPGVFVLGRDPAVDVPLPVDGVSRKHARLSIDASGAVAVVDLSSRNGTFLNGRRIEQSPMRDGDELRVGPVVLRLRYVAARPGAAKPAVVATPVAVSPPVASPPVASSVIASPPVASPVIASPPVASPVIASPPVASPVIASPVAASPAGAAPVAPALPLSPRELEVARLVASGMTNAEIGKQLHISPATVGRHLSNVYERLGIHSRAALAARLGPPPPADPAGRR